MVGKVYNIDMAIADTEYSFHIPANAKYVLIKGRSGLSDIKLAYQAGQSGVAYITIPATSTKTMTGTDLSTMSDIVLYFQSSIPDVVEIEAWQ